MHSSSPVLLSNTLPVSPYSVCLNRPSHSSLCYSGWTPAPSMTNWGKTTRITFRCTCRDFTSWTLRRWCTHQQEKGEMEDALTGFSSALNVFLEVRSVSCPAIQSSLLLFVFRSVRNVSGRCYQQLTSSCPTLTRLPWLFTSPWRQTLGLTLPLSRRMSHWRIVLIVEIWTLNQHELIDAVAGFPPAHTLAKVISCPEPDTSHLVIQLFNIWQHI